MKKSVKSIIAVALVAVIALAVFAGCSKKDSSSITIAVPNDTTNEARALLLLQEQGYIKLKDGAGRHGLVDKFFIVKGQPGPRDRSVHFGMIGLHKNPFFGKKSAAGGRQYSVDSRWERQKGRRTCFQHHCIPSERSFCRKPVLLILACRPKS